jgi:hypothetical protein
MTTFQALTVAHMLLTMGGYAGLIATNAWLLLLFRSGETAVVVSAMRTWQRAARIFGPLLGLGVLIGFATALVSGISLVAPWLIVTYALLMLVLVGHAALMVPLNLRVNAIASGNSVSTRPIALAISLLLVGYVCIPALMFVRPS